MVRRLALPHELRKAVEPALMLIRVPLVRTMARGLPRILRICADREVSFIYGAGGSGLCYTSYMSTEELLAEVLRLPRRERARIAENLLSSLEESEEAVAVAWAEELQRRSRETFEGRVETVPWETVRSEILRELDERRARRNSS